MCISWFVTEKLHTVCIDIILKATRWLPYIVGVVDGEWGYFPHIEPVDVLLEQSKQGKVQGSQPCLLALENKRITQQNISRSHMQKCKQQMHEGSTYFWTVAVIKCVLYHQILQHLDGYLTNVPELLQSCTDLPEQHPNQEVVLTEVICQRVIKLEVWGQEEDDEDMWTGWQRSMWRMCTNMKSQTTLNNQSKFILIRHLTQWNIKKKCLKEYRLFTALKPGKQLNIFLVGKWVLLVSM